VSLYVAQRPPADALEQMGFHESERGANLWLIEPNDEAVFADAEQTDGIWHVSALQAYLAELRRRWLNPEATSGPREAP